MLPTLTFKDEIYTFTLRRNGKKVIHEFGSYPVLVKDQDKSVIHGVSFVTIGSIEERTILPAARAKIDGPAFDGILYYICAQPFQGEDIVIWLSKEESEVLQPILDDIQEEEFQKNEYQFTRTTLKDMAKNPSQYGPQQRARAMVCCPLCSGALTGIAYRPSCSKCDWDYDNDYHDAYRQHPLDHE
jgi:hypothetical protein